MPVTSKQRNTVESLFKAMQAGPSGEDAMVGLYTDNAVFIAPFSGLPQTHRPGGNSAEFLRSVEQPPAGPDVGARPR